MNVDHQYDPAAHYDHVTAAWNLLLGDDLHYGVFDTGSETLPAATAALTQRMVDAAEFTAGQRVLDVGCGTGGPACTLVEDHGVEVLGITPSAVGVEAATTRAKARGLAAATFESRDGTNNGLPDQSFDRVWVLESSHLMPARDSLIAECARVLRPGGRLVLCDIIRHRDLPFEEVRERRHDLAVLRKAFGPANMESLDFYADAARDHGLVVDRRLDLTSATLPTFDRWRANAAAHRDDVVASVGLDGLDAFGRGTEILEQFWQDGTLGYGLVAAHKNAER